MRKQLLVGAMAVALAAGTTTSAMAFRGGGSFHGGGFHSGGFGGFHSSGFNGFRSSGFSGVPTAGTVGGWRGGAFGARNVGWRNSFAAMPSQRWSGVRGFNTSVRPGLGWNRGWAGRRFVGGGWGWGGRHFVRRGWGWGGGWGWDPGFDVGLGLAGFGLGVAALSSTYCSPYDYGWGWDYGYCGYPGYSTYVAW
jgi:hypothetical protein